MSGPQTLPERIDELVQQLGITRKQARKALMRNVSTGGDGISRLQHHDPTAVQAIRNLERQQRRTRD